MSFFLLNFRIYDELNSTEFNGSKKFVARYNFLNVSEHFEAVKHSTNNDHYMLIDDLTFIEFNKKNELSGVKLLKKKLLPVTIPFAAAQCYYLRILMQQKLKQMEVAGLIEFYMREYSDRKYLELMEKDEGPQKLRLDQLEIGFQAFLLFLGVAAIVFVLKILWFSLEKIAVLVAVWRVLMFQY